MEAVARIETGQLLWRLLFLLLWPLTDDDRKHQQTSSRKLAAFLKLLRKSCKISLLNSRNQLCSCFCHRLPVLFFRAKAWLSCLQWLENSTQRHLCWKVNLQITNSSTRRESTAGERKNIQILFDIFISKPAKEMDKVCQSHTFQGTQKKKNKEKVCKWNAVRFEWKFFISHPTPRSCYFSSVILIGKVQAIRNISWQTFQLFDIEILHFKRVQKCMLSLQIFEIFSLFPLCSLASLFILVSRVFASTALMWER